MKRVACLAVSLLGASAAYGQCSSFQPAYPGLNGPVKVLASWDPDGSGPLPPRLVAGGAFTWNEGQGSQDYIAWWDGTQWSNIGWGPDAPVNAITTWDPDGDGPLPAQLIMGGEFPDVGADSTGAITVNYIARWDGEAWQPLGIGADGPVDALTTWDPDGAGPLPAKLVAAGRFTHIGGVWTGGVAYWDGVAWHSFGWGIDGAGAALTVWDPDGSGPQTPRLVVGGTFQHAGADSTGEINAHYIAYWNGSSWHAMGSIQTSVRCLTVVGTQGSSPRLYAAGSGVKHWDGTSWQDDHFAFNQGDGFGSAWLIAGTAFTMTEWDPDGAGPMPSSLYAAGQYTYYVVPCGKNCGGYNVTANVIARLDETAWTVVRAGPGSDGSGQAVLSFDPDGGGGSHSALVAGAPSSPFVASLESYSYPLLDVLPESVTVHARDTVTFSVHSTDTAASYQWYRFEHSQSWFTERGGYVRLADGPTTMGSIISGSRTGTLTVARISNVRFFNGFYGISDSTSYQCVITDACGQAHLVDVDLDVLPGSCSADFNNDGDVGTDADIQAFFACLSGNCCAACGDADFNGDGDVGTDADIDSFFRVLGGGAC